MTSCGSHFWLTAPIYSRSCLRWWWEWTMSVMVHSHRNYTRLRPKKIVAWVHSHREPTTALIYLHVLSFVTECRHNELCCVEAEIILFCNLFCKGCMQFRWFDAERMYVWVFMSYVATTGFSIFHKERPFLICASARWANGTCP